MLFLLVVGCGRQAPAPPAPPAPPSTEDSETAPSAGPTALYASDGSLLPSGEVVAGLPLPRGLEPILSQGREHVYRSKVPLEKLQRYFGPRLLTGQVEPLGGGVVYRGARPRDARGGVVRLDVKLVPGAAGTRVEIVELPPEPEHPPSVEELRARARSKGPPM